MMSAKRISVIVCFLWALIFNSAVLHAQDSVVISARIVNAQAQPVESASISLYRLADQTLLGRTISDSTGQFVLKLPSECFVPFRLKVSCIGYQTLEGAYHQTELGTLMLRDDVHQLQEVEVNASMVREFSSHSTYRIDLKKAKLFSNFLESLTLIPALSLDTSRELKATNGGEVIILINGVKSTQTALAALAAEDVKSVELYDTPPARFATAGIGALINVITKEKIRGGNLYIEANDAVTAWDGKNRLGINYTIDRLRLNATYSNIYWRYKASEDEEIRYRFLGQDYYQKKTGIVAPGGRDNNELQLSCSYSVPKNYLLSSSLLLHHYRQDLRTDQIVSDGSLSGSKISKGNGNRYTMYAVDLYGEKVLAKEHSLLCNLHYTDYTTKVDAYYNALSYRKQTDMDGHKKSFIADAQYRYSSQMFSTSIGAKGLFEYNAQQLLLPQNKLIESFRRNIRGYGDISWMKGAFRHQAILGLEYNSSRSPQLDQSFESLHFTPLLRSTWVIRAGTSLSLSYQHRVTAPTISMLSNTPIPNAPHYVYIGNPKLTPSAGHNLSLSFNMRTSYVSGQVSLFYSHASNAIVPYLEERSEYIVKSYKNIGSKALLGGVGKLNVMPWGDPRLVLTLEGDLYRQAFYIKPENSFNISGRLSASLNLNTTHWVGFLSIQSRRKILDGQFIIHSPAYNAAELCYRLNPALMFGVGGKYLFMETDGYGNSTDRSAILSSNSWQVTPTLMNTIYLKLSIQLNMGRKAQEQRPKANNRDTDSGLLTL